MPAPSTGEPGPATTPASVADFAPASGATFSQEDPAATVSDRSGESGDGNGQSGAESGKTWRPHEMGRLFVEDIDATDTVAAFQKVVPVIAKQIENFAATHQLTKEQADFLALYQEDPTCEKMLATESGAIAAFTMMEQEAVLRLISVGREMKLTTKNIKSKDARLTMDLPGFDSRTRWDKFKKSFENVLDSIGGGLFRRKGAQIDLTDLANLDIGRLPSQYQDYIEWAQSNVTEGEVADYLMNTASAQLEFYKAIKVDATQLNALQPWNRLRLGEDIDIQLSPADFSQNYAADWNQFRLEKLKDLGVYTTSLSRDERLEMFFNAQRQTVAEFTSRRLNEVDTGQSGKYSNSIDKLTTHRDEIGKGKDSARAKGIAKDEMAAKAIELKANNTKLDEVAEQLADVEKSLKEIDDNKQDWETDEIPRLESEINGLDVTRQSLIDERTQEIQDFPGLIGGALNANVARAEKTAHDHRVTLLSQQIDEIERDESEGGQGYNSRVNELRLLRWKINNETSLERRKLKYEQERTDLEAISAGFDADIDALNVTIEGGLTPDEKKKKEKLDAAIVGLGRFGKVFSTLNDPRKINQFSARSLSDTTLGSVANGAISDLPKGYIDTLYVVFDPVESRPEGTHLKEYWEASMKLLPEDVLADTLADALDLTISITGTTPAATLQLVYDQIRAGHISREDMHRAFFRILETVERNALSID